VKILMMVSQFFPVGVGGAERQCLHQAQALAQRGNHVMILTKWLDPSSARAEKMEDVFIWRRGCYFSIRKALRPRWMGHGGRLTKADVLHPRDIPTRLSDSRSRRQILLEKARNILFMAEVIWGIKMGRLKADVIHVHESNWLAGFAQKVGEWMGIPVFCKESTRPVLRQTDMTDVPWKTAWKSRRMQCRFVAITEGIATDLADAGIPSSRIVKIPNGVEIPDEIADTTAHAEALYVGNFTQGECKAFDILLQAWGKALQQEPGMRLHLYGRGDTHQWESFAEEHGCGSSVIFEGETDDIWAAHRQSGFIVLPSRREGLSNALLEAMASGLPAVVSDIPGNTAAVQDGLSGQVIPVNDVDALAEAMLEMARNPEMRVRMGHSARQRAKDYFSMEKVAEQLEQAYASSRPLTSSVGIQ